jgi:hypothetical protein
MFTPPVTRGAGCRRFGPERSPHWGFPWSAGGVAIGVDKLAVTQCVPEGEAVRLILGWRDLPPLPGTPLTATSATNYRRNRARRRADQPLPRAARRQPR